MAMRSGRSPVLNRFKVSSMSFLVMGTVGRPSREEGCSGVTPSTMKRATEPEAAMAAAKDFNPLTSFPSPRKKGTQAPSFLPTAWPTRDHSSLVMPGSTSTTWVGLRFSSRCSP